MKTEWLRPVTIMGVFAAASAFAHHSIAVFDQEKEVSIAGSVKKFSYTNPHGWIDVEVPNDKGGVDEWSIEMGTTAQLRRQGWTPDTLKVGDKIKVTLHPRRDGTKAGNIVGNSLTLDDGTPIGKPRGGGPGGPNGGPNSGMGAGGPNGGPDGGMGAGNSRKVGVLEEPAHPLLKDLVPKLIFGLGKMPQPTEGKMTPPSPDPKNFAGRYLPNESTLLLPGENTRMLPYNDAGAKLFLGRASDFAAGKLRNDVLSLCKPAGVIRAMNQGFLAQIAQTPDEVTLIHYEDHLVRHIYLNAEHPKDVKPSFMGHSVGHWEGNTLVVDTVGFRDGGWMDEYGSPSSDKLHVSERIAKRSDGTLQFDITFEDPTYYTKPVSITRTWEWNPTVSWDEVICEENNRDAPKT